MSFIAIDEITNEVEVNRNGKLEAYPGKDVCISFCKASLDLIKDDETIFLSSSVDEFLYKNREKFKLINLPIGKDQKFIPVIIPQRLSGCSRIKVYEWFCKNGKLSASDFGYSAYKVVEASLDCGQLKLNRHEIIVIERSADDVHHDLNSDLRFRYDGAVLEVDKLIWTVGSRYLSFESLEEDLRDYIADSIDREFDEELFRFYQCCQKKAAANSFDEEQISAICDQIRKIFE